MGGLKYEGRNLDSVWDEVAADPTARAIFNKTVRTALTAVPEGTDTTEVRELLFAETGEDYKPESNQGLDADSRLVEHPDEGEDY